jgi:sugar phosphate permease
MNEEIKDLKERIITMEERNNRVEKDKRWETSRTRIFLVCIITYIVAYSYMRISNTQNILFASLFQL